MRIKTTTYTRLIARYLRNATDTDAPSNQSHKCQKTCYVYFAHGKITPVLDTSHLVKCQSLLRGESAHR